MTNAELVKLEIFIQCSHLDVLREALRSARAGAIGNYDSALGMCDNRTTAKNPVNIRAAALVLFFYSNLCSMVFGQTLELRIKK